MPIRSLARVAFVVFVLAVGSTAAEEPARATATFAGGCFWCTESLFKPVNGVISTAVGYTGGTVKDPTYEQVSSGTTGHTESVQVVYDPTRITYEKLLDIFWKNIDPMAIDAQFCDQGDQYRSAIFHHDDAQKRAAEASKAEVEKKLGRKVVTEIAPAKDFWRAEEYHQRYEEKNPLRYQAYRWGCGRDAKLKEIWGAEAGGPKP